MTKAAIAVQALKQSIWLDNISRGQFPSGEFELLVREEGVVGVTSNPTIFEKAITGSHFYDDQLRELAGHRDISAVFDQLAVRDLQQAADILRPVYDRTNGGDGFVSWEVSPELADDTEATLSDARRLWATLDRPNGMIKIPGTRAGLPAIEQSLYEGININITLLFSIERYEAVMEAYLSALERRLAEGKDISKIRSVASFFVSRVDTAVDAALKAKIDEASEARRPQIVALRSRAAVANAKLAYQRFKAIFAGPRWQRLADAGAALQRPLWASTSTKDPTLPDTYYVDALIGPHTVNTLPPATLTAFNDHGRVAATLEEELPDAQAVIAALADNGIDLAAVTDQLEKQGVRSFADSFVSLRQGIEAKMGEVQRLSGAGVGDGN